MTSTSNERRTLHRVMIEINTSLASIHKRLPLKIDVDRYKAATDYVSQFIPYTTIWNVKFTYNLESPEVALMQIMHLQYILSQEPHEQFTKERAILEEMTQLFLAYTPYSNSLINVRKKRFLQHIENA